MNREPFVAAMAIAICDMIDAAGEASLKAEEIFARMAAKFPDATRSELREAIQLYMSQVPANDDEEIS